MGRTKRKSSQPEAQELAPFSGPLQALQRLLEAFNDQGVIIGGVAASLLGTPRFTADVDAVVLLGLEDLQPFIDAASKEDLQPRTADPIRFARRTRMLLLRHPASGIDIDISLGVLPFEIEMIQRSRLVEVGSIRLRLPTPEDLIIMKAVAHRPKDLEDIQAVAASHPKLDKKRIQYWVEQFSTALELPDLWAMIEKELN
jgi:predicted nucleotidyltransferase